MSDEWYEDSDLVGNDIEQIDDEDWELEPEIVEIKDKIKELRDYENRSMENLREAAIEMEEKLNQIRRLGRTYENEAEVIEFINEFKTEKN